MVETVRKYAVASTDCPPYNWTQPTDPNSPSISTLTFTLKYALPSSSRGLGFRV